ncbi:MAG: DUF2807 domain-containing protein [Roseivirga sp.]|nr:DUF2807 domain-containing protein [Roseivirga sp.]
MRTLLTILFIASFSLTTLAQNKETRDVRDFDEVAMRVAGKVLITQGNKNEVILEGDPDLLEEIETEVRGGRLNIKNKRERWWRSNNRRNRLTVYITVKKLRGAYVSGSGDIISQNTLKTDDFTASIAGSGDIEIDIEAEYVQSKISGSGNIELQGKSDRAKLSISGSGKYLAEKLTVGDYQISMSGSGRGSINVDGDLDVRISGSGKIYYMGRPTSVNSSVSGSGSVRKIN